MSTRSRTALLAVLVLVVSAGCLANGPEEPSNTPTGTWVQGTTPSDGSPLVPTDAVMERFTTGVGVCERSNVPVRMNTSQSALEPNVTITIDGAIAVSSANRRAPPPGLSEPEPNRYVLYVSTRPIPDTEEEPCDSQGHVPYEAILVFPHDSLDDFHLTIVHDDEPVATWGNESV
ncbi:MULTISPECIES: hypothetical protein [Haloferax]|uniref:Lipoprotein n=1 Tax=Haloferax marinum TaxID=2666143 RepID=A0A6A8G4X7_9EURY|nr:MULTISPECIES: hypothetical protein [Haloferax]KAB1197215.1 hypothetical protein Hfx1150_06665 [Haloferax sp. CBA1150]MRW96254.1 hypothetical protein [Haloferax marinum]